MPFRVVIWNKVFKKKYIKKKRATQTEFEFKLALTLYTLTAAVDWAAMVHEEEAEWLNELYITVVLLDIVPSFTLI